MFCILLVLFGLGLELSCIYFHIHTTLSPSTHCLNVIYLIHSTSNTILSQMLPLLYEHFRNEGVTSEMFLLDWMLSIFTKVPFLHCYLVFFRFVFVVVFSSCVTLLYLFQLFKNKLLILPLFFLTHAMLMLLLQTLPLEVAAHIWDVYLFEGEMYLMCVALGILKLYAPRYTQPFYQLCHFVLQYSSKSCR